MKSRVQIFQTLHAIQFEADMALSRHVQGHELGFDAPGLHRHQFAAFGAGLVGGAALQIPRVNNARPLGGDLPRMDMAQGPVVITFGNQRLHAGGGA